MIKKIGFLALLLAMSACSSEEKPPVVHDEPPAKEAEKPFRADGLICPQVAILKNAEEVFDYGREKADPSQLVAKALMKHVSGDCAYRPNGIDISFTLDMASSRGPRLGTQVSFPYFVAIVDPAENILSRQLMTAQFKFAGSEKVVETHEPLHVFIPLTGIALQAGPDYRVLVGFNNK